MSPLLQPAFSILLFIKILRDPGITQIVIQWGGARDFASLTSFQVMSMLLVHGPCIHSLGSKVLHYYMLQFCVLMIILTSTEHLTLTRHYLKYITGLLHLSLVIIIEVDTLIPTLPMRKLRQRNVK